MAYRRGQAYSQDLRDRVLAAPGSAAIVGARFGVSRSYVIKARQRRDRQGELCAGAPPPSSPGMMQLCASTCRARRTRRLRNSCNGQARNSASASALKGCGRGSKRSI